MPIPGLSLLGLKRIRGFVSILRYINPTIIIMSRCSFPAFNSRLVDFFPSKAVDHQNRVEALEERDFQTFRNKAEKILSGTQSRAKEKTHQPQQPTLSRSSSATSTYVPQTFQQPQQQAPAAREYILHIPETQIPVS